jgi:hypothetical protein
MRLALVVVLLPQYLPREQMTHDDCPPPEKKPTPHITGVTAALRE